MTSLTAPGLGIRDMVVLIKYELKQYLRMDVASAWAFAAILPWAFWLPPAEGARAAVALSGLETYTCLGAPLLAGAILSREHETGTAEAILGKPFGPRTLAALRLLLAFFGVACLSGVAALSYAARGAAMEVPSVLLATLPGALFLGAAAALVGAWGRVSAAGYLAPISYWLVDFATKGRYTGSLTLFGAALGQEGWQGGKLYLVTVGLAMAAVTVALAGRRR